MAGKVEEPESGLGLWEEVVGGGRSENVVGPVEIGVDGVPGTEAVTKNGECRSFVEAILEKEVEVANNGDGGDVENEDRDGVSVETAAIKLYVDFSEYASMDSSKGVLSANDLVWGKVRSHPWWPGQIVDCSAASASARKYFKPGCLLVAFFGDQTFAWSEVSRLRPFGPCFWQMEKEASSWDFQYAVHCALDEVSRRVEFGLSCSCVPEYGKIKMQIIVNAGVRDGYTRCYGRDSFSDLVSFEPEKLAGYVKSLGQFPNGGVDMLEFVTARAQLLAWNRWKGYPRLPEFQVLGTLLFDNAEVPKLQQGARGEIKKQDGAIKAKDNELVLSTKSKSKRKYSPFGTAVNLRKKQRSLADLLASSFVPVLLDSKDAIKFSCSDKKRKATDDVELSNWIGDYDSLRAKRTCSDGYCYHPDAGHLNGIISNDDSVHGTSQTAMLKHGSKLRSAKTKAKSKFLSRSRYGKVLSPMELLPTDEIASQLWSMARDPTNGCCCVETVRNFFTEFRNSVHPNVQELRQPFNDHVSDNATPKEAIYSVDESPEFEAMKDSYWTDMIIQSIPVEQSNMRNDDDGEMHVHSLANGYFYLTEQQSAAHIPSVQMQHPLTTEGQLEEKCYDDASVTALILNFTNSKSLPPKKELNKIFGRFGPLKKSKTEVLKKSKRAKVVFCKRADAEAAFSSAGKYSIFGPSLASYRLKYDC